MSQPISGGKESGLSQFEEVFSVIKRLEKFDPNSDNIDNFNAELNLQLQFLRKESLKENPNFKEIDAQINYVVDRIKANQVKPNDQTFALMFEKSVHFKELEKANGYLNKLVHSP